jgi:hypothetical protein
LACVPRSFPDGPEGIAVSLLGGRALLALYGLTDIVTGSIRADRGTVENAIWYAALWGPIWLLGGVLFLMTAWTFDASER